MAGLRPALPRNGLRVPLRQARVGLQDPDVVFPARTLRRLAETGSIGSVAPMAASTMGYIPKGLNVLDRVVPPVVASLAAQQVDLALLVPA